MCVLCGFSGQLPKSVLVNCGKCAELVEVPNLMFKRADTATTPQGLVIAAARRGCLTCEACPNLKKLNLPQMLNDLFYMRCPRCPRLSAITGPCGINRINLYSCPGLRMISIAAGVRALTVQGCPFVLFIPFVPTIVDLHFHLQPFTHVSRRYDIRHTTTEAKIRRWLWRGRVAARARAELGSTALHAALLIPPLANIAVGYLARRRR